MLVLIITENGQKKIIPLTADAGAGNPVGTIIPMYKKSSPSGYLYCDGSTFDQTKYPLLYAYLGSNVLPDYREAAIVGAEQNTTDTIASHDVYTEGQFKDDQLQNHGHYITDPGHKHSYNDGFPARIPDGRIASGSDYTPTSSNTGNTNTKTTGISIENPNSGRHGDVTRGKRKAVYFYIKATSGLSENAQDNVVAQLNEERSYSTEEHWTGKYWIDGKKIYSKTINCGALPADTTKQVAHGITNLGHFVKGDCVAYGSNNDTIFLPYDGSIEYLAQRIYWSLSSNIIFFRAIGNLSSYTNTYVTLEYTKTTD